jgi:hypothetical protein
MKVGSCAAERVVFCSMGIVSECCPSVLPFSQDLGTSCSGLYSCSCTLLYSTLGYELKLSLSERLSRAQIWFMTFGALSTGLIQDVLFKDQLIQVKLF